MCMYGIDRYHIDIDTDTDIGGWGTLTQAVLEDIFKRKC